MKKLYLKVAGTNEHINLDVYEPLAVDGPSNARPKPAVVIVSGGGGKDLLKGDPHIGKHAAGYHDLGEAISQAGFWGIIPSRRGDPQRNEELRSKLSDEFRNRLPEELLQDEGPNDGLHSHLNHVAEVTWLVENSSSIFGPGLDSDRVGLIGKSAGGGVALAAAAALGKRIRSVAVWGSALRTSQWFAGPMADSFFKEVLDNRRIRYEREMFLDQMCDAVDFVAQVESPLLFACAVPDPYAPKPPEPDKWSNLNEQITLLQYSIRSRHGQVVGLKGAEHTMYQEQPAWRAYASLLAKWFEETLSGVGPGNTGK